VCARIEGEEEGRNEDVEIGGIRYVTLRDDDGGAVLAVPVDEDRGVNFVTVLTPNVNGGGDDDDDDDDNDPNGSSRSSSKSVTIETLLTPQIFDEGVGDALVVSGVVDLKYVDAGGDGRRGRRRRLQVADGPAREFFNVVVPLRKTKDLPRVAEGLFMDKFKTTNGAAAAVVVDGGGGGKWGWRPWRWRGKKTYWNGMSKKALFRVLLSSALAVTAIV